MRSLRHILLGAVIAIVLFCSFGFYDTEIVSDSTVRYFGSDRDVSFEFDGTNFEMFAIAADTPWAIGGTTYGFDITYSFEAAGQFRIDYDGDFINLTDDMEFRLGTGASSDGDFKISSNSDNIFQIEQVVLDTGTIEIGVDNRDIPIKWYAETASSYLNITGDDINIEAMNLALGDGDAILLGDALGTGCFSLSSTSAVLSLVQIAADTGTMVIGEDGTDIPIIWYAETASAELTLTGDTAVFDNIEVTIKDRLVFNENVGRTGEGSYIFANGLAIGMTATADVGDCQGVKMEFDYGTTPEVTGAGKTATGLICKFVMDADWDFTSADRNAVVRGAMLHAESEGNVGGRVQGAYINAKASGTTEGILGTFATGATSVGLMAIEARTELGTSCALTTPRVAGILVFHNQKSGSSLTGEYAAIQIDQPLHAAGGISEEKYGILFTDDHATVNCEFDYAFGFEDNLDNDSIAHYSAGYTTDGDDVAVDGWIKVDVDGHALYIYLWPDKPT